MNGETSRVYADGEKVPYPTYRCKAAISIPAKHELHKCKRLVDHEGDHKCICTKQWPRKVA